MKNKEEKAVCAAGKSLLYFFYLCLVYVRKRDQSERELARLAPTFGIRAMALVPHGAGAGGSTVSFPFPQLTATNYTI